MTDIEKRNGAVDALNALNDTLKQVEKSNALEKTLDSYDPASLQQTLARLAAAALATDEAVDELADIFAALAVKDYCPAMRFDREYVLAVESDDMVEEALAPHEFPSDALYEAVRDATVMIVDDMGGPWMRHSDYDLVCGCDEPLPVELLLIRNHPTTTSPSKRSEF